MTRTVTIVKTLYKFSELSDKAKERAREWWWNCEASDPAWQSEHKESASHAFREVSRLHKRMENYPEEISDTLEDWANVIKESRDIKWTAYTDDSILYDNAEPSTIPHPATVADWYDDAWNAEIEDRLSDESVDENILANDYEFDESGAIQ
jgi:hypothetical protein